VSHFVAFRRILSHSGVAAGPEKGDGGTADPMTSLGSVERPTAAPPGTDRIVPP